MIKKKILFLGKRNDTYTLKALKYLRSLFNDVNSFLGDWGENFPEQASKWKGDIIISYLSRWIVPEHLLVNSKEVAINFHPASPDYPGIGCINFALYEDAKKFGATCHHLSNEVDKGSIIKVSRFDVYPFDNVETLLTRTYEHQLHLFYEIINYIYNGISLPKSDEMWTRDPTSRKDLNELCQITLDMDIKEIKKRIRATLFKNYRPKLSFSGFTFELKNDY